MGKGFDLEAAKLGGVAGQRPGVHVHLEQDHAVDARPPAHEKGKQPVGHLDPGLPPPRRARLSSSGTLGAPIAE